MIGRTLSHFKVTAKLGEGGMGAVYRAVDTRLGREVAIKVLTENIIGDAERLARFEREARVLASLNHPNIAALHQIEEVDGNQLLVMELVPGKDIAERLARGPIAIEEAVRIAVQIASGLEAAHARGIVHRDLKPANIRVTPEGQVKILDFGLARPHVGADEAAEDLSESPTLTAQMTRAGVVLGTAAYMSPEQARGEAADQRADIWSFGVVLYELLTGRRLFAESTATDTLAAVLRAEIDWGQLPRETPQRLRRLLRRCLERNPRQRLHAIADARIEFEAPEDETGIPTTGRPGISSAWKLILPAALGGAIAAAVVLSFVGLPGGRSEERGPLRVAEVVPGVGVDLFDVYAGLNESEPRVSPDGSMIVYPSEGRLWIRDMNRLAPRPLEETDGARDALWSPDSQEIAIVVGTELRRIDAHGGPGVVLAQLNGAYIGGTWGAGDRIVVALAGRGLFEIPGRGGEPRELLPPDTASGDFDIHSPAFLGDSTSIAFFAHENVGYRRTLEVFDGSERRVIYRVPAGSELTSLAFDATAGQLIFTITRANAGLWALPFVPGGDLGEVEPRLLIPHGLAPSVGADGSLIYVDGLRVEPNRLLRVDRKGEVVAKVGEALWDMDRPATSPDGSKVATVARQGGSREVWVHDLERDTALRVAADDPEMTAGVAWADDGEDVVYVARSGERSRMMKRRADGAGEAVVLMEGEVGQMSLPRDSSFLVYQIGGSRLQRGQGDICWFPIGRPDAAAPLIATLADEVQPAVSPDGRLLAYTSDDSGRYEVYLWPISGEGNRLRVSAQGGELPIWNRDGSELYYVEDSTLMAVSVGADGQSLGSPERLFAGSDVSSPLVKAGVSQLALGPDGDFLVIPDQIPGNPVVVAVQNWTRLLED